MENKKWYDNMLMINRDPNWYGAVDVEEASVESITKSVNKFFSYYKGSKITDIAIGVLEQTAMVPNSHIMWRGSKYLMKKENGVDVDYSCYRNIYNCYEKYHVDPVKIFIEEMNSMNIRPWLTLRMNDTHKPSFLTPDHYYEAVKAGHTLGPAYAYNSGAMDFKYPEYPNKLLGFIGELLDRYDMFGLELDFMRQIRCFDYKNEPECHKIMTEFVRKVHKLVEKASERRGCKIPLSIRTCRDIEDAFAFGFDIKTMADEGLVDIVVVTPDWGATDFDIPIDKWKQLLGADFPILFGIETQNLYSTLNTVYHEKAYAAAAFTNGADGLYFNNHERYNDRNERSWNLTRENVFEGRREFVITRKDTYAFSNSKVKPFPMRVERDECIRLKVGPIKPEDKVSVVLNFQGEETPKLAIKDKVYEGNTKTNDIIAFGLFENERSMTPDMAVAYYVNGISTDNELTLTFLGDGTITYVDIIIDAV